MADWKYTLKNSSLLRSAIRNEDPKAVLDALERIWIEIYSHFDNEDIYSNAELEDDLEDIHNEEYDMTLEVVIDNIDYLCNKLYDFCDAERIWIDI